MKVEPMSNAVVTASTLQAFADQLPGWLDQRNNVALGQLVEQLMPIIDRRAADIAAAVIDQRRVNVDGDAVRTIASDVARQVAEDTTSRLLAQVDTGQQAPALDVDKLRFDVIDSAMKVVTDHLPALVAAANADTVHEVIRDRDGRIKKIETKAR